MAERLGADSRVARAQLGDELAFTELYDEYAPRVYRFLLLRVRQPADAEDRLQRVFLKVIEALPGFQERGLPFGAWLFRIARNSVIDFDRTRRANATLDDVVEQPDDLPGPTATSSKRPSTRPTTTRPGRPSWMLWMCTGWSSRRLLQSAPAAATGGLEQALSQVGEADRHLRAKDPSSPLASPTPKKSTPDRTDRPDPTRRPSNR